MGAKRMIVTLPEEVKAWLQGYSRTHGISVAEAIRQGIDRLREEDGQELYRRLLEETRGLWRQGDGLDYQRKMRAEWDR